MAPADIEWVFGVVRAGRDYQGMEHAKSGGCGYEFTATIIVRGRTAEIVGGAGRLTPALAKEIEIVLHSHGITTAIWERYNGDPKRLVRATRGRSGKENGKADPGPDSRTADSPVPDHPSPGGQNPCAQNLPGHHGLATLMNGNATLMNGFRQEMETAFVKPPGGGRARDLERKMHQKVGNG
ncbi:hypothetical protein [Pedomonas mirosovicensis]|uniref:hypothetical protein n=1 Tax=Pedomonas mirosovicensis TaxID=2908641 RepID=UPI002167320C|nr:hypothetical protein [Pedomonas mirosovicensis]MCH8684814.1 hypothetical protein [Pedomonas mirosovicensis]